MGRPTEYNAKRPGQARFICRQWGADRTELAKALGISPATLYDWEREYPEFLEAVQQGSAEHDNEVVAASILACARGYEYTERSWDSKNGIFVDIAKRRHPDVRAQALWMMNRQGWRMPGPMKELPPGGSTGGEGERGAEEDSRVAGLAKDILENRHQTQIHVDSEEVNDGRETTDGDGGSDGSEPEGAGGDAVSKSGL